MMILVGPSRDRATEESTTKRHHDAKILTQKGREPDEGSCVWREPHGLDRLVLLEKDQHTKGLHAGETEELEAFALDDGGLEDAVDLHMDSVAALRVHRASFRIVDETRASVPNDRVDFESDDGREPGFVEAEADPCFAQIEAVEHRLTALYGPHDLTDQSIGRPSGAENLTAQRQSVERDFINEFTFGREDPTSGQDDGFAIRTLTALEPAQLSCAADQRRAFGRECENSVRAEHFEVRHLTPHPDRRTRQGDRSFVEGGAALAFRPGQGPHNPEERLGNNIDAHDSELAFESMKALGVEQNAGAAIEIRAIDPTIAGEFERTGELDEESLLGGDETGDTLNGFERAQLPGLGIEVLHREDRIRPQVGWESHDRGLVPARERRGADEYPGERTHERTAPRNGARHQSITRSRAESHEVQRCSSGLRRQNDAVSVFGCGDRVALAIVYAVRPQRRTHRLGLFARGTRAAMSLLAAITSACSSAVTTPDAGTTDAGPRPTTTSPCAASKFGGPSGAWEIICDGEPLGQLLSVWGSSADDVYFVGGVPGPSGGDGRTVVWHFDGRTISQLEVPGTERAWWVYGTDADHVWVVGERGLGLERINRGPFVPFDTGTSQTIFGIWGATPEQLYFASGDFVSATGRGQLHERTSSGVRVVSDPDLAAFEGRALFKVWGTSANDVFASGELGAVFHFDGTSWARMVTPDDRTPLLTLSGIGPSEVYAVGGRGVGALWRYDGSEWRDAAPMSEFPGLMGVSASLEAPLMVSGEGGTLAELVGGLLRSEEVITENGFPIHAVWTDEGGGRWAVGGNLFATTGDARSLLMRKATHRCEPGSVRGPGFHHLDLQGRGATPREDGTYPMFDVPRGDIHPELVHGEHYLLGPGSFVEFSIPLCDDITDEIVMRLPNNDEPGAVARHELFITRGDREILVAAATDDEPGSMGYLPFNRTNLPREERERIAQTKTDPTKSETGWQEFLDAPGFAEAPRDIFAKAGDTLTFRSTNISDKMYGLMVWFPQRGLEYQAFIEVRVPEVPGGIEDDGRPPPPEPGPCAPPSESAFVELGRGETSFTPFPPYTVPVVVGPQGSLMFVLAIRGAGFAPGDPARPSDPTNPLVTLRLALDRLPSEGGRVVADGTWRRGFSTEGDRLVLTDVRPTVPVGAASMVELLGQTIHAEIMLTDALSGTTFCQAERLTATQ